jgi:hypothetical protein
MTSAATFSCFNRINSSVEVLKFVFDVRILLTMTLDGRPALTMVITLSFVRISALKAASCPIAGAQTAAASKIATPRHIFFLMEFSLVRTCEGAMTLGEVLRGRNV